MNTDDKVYKPEEIAEQPFPQEDATIASLNGQPSGSDIYRPATTPDSGFLRRTITQETISQSLNTKSRKILGEFQFTTGGAIQIGEYANGINGDIRISPGGILARDSSGNTSFALDGETGDATFRGTVSANDFEITGGGIIATATEGKKSLGGFDSIQEAVDWVNGFGGGEVLLPAGTYDCSTANINLYANTFLIGQDDGNTILDFKASNFRVKITGTNGNFVKNIRIANLGFINHQGDDTGAIKVNYAQDLIIENCTFTGGRNYYPDALADLYIENSQRITISRCKFIDSMAAINLFSNFIGIVSECYFENPRSTGIQLPGGADFIVANNYFSGADLECISMAGNDDGITQIIHNVAEDCAQAFLLADGVEHALVAYNSISAIFGGANTYSLIFFDTASLYNRIIGNFCRWASGGSGAGIEISDNCSRNIISENVCVSNVYGIWVDVATATKNIVTNNITYLNSTSNITDSGTTTTLANNITS